jgi:hypothetical protein
MGHIEISSFSAFDERRSVPRDVEKDAYIYRGEGAVGRVTFCNFF